MENSVIINGKVFTDKIGEKALCSITDKNVVIPEGITEIGSYSFFDLPYVTKIILPHSLLIYKFFAL